ncbi:ZapG family protein [Salinisphaera sp. Q1T1-3]|uniref:ZapG family protein n=1 Tax=Salinisphaera sp. Q1T1-3 TaxID=2321229 RepID=UPI000E73AF3B|nr:DUF1043 family protein [Salinisphaera sp. Q1T1-3]RJS93348.1 DUF1043 family protein [Salinisphaera sp. Q1T1-3]
MPHLSPVAWIIIIALAAVVALIVGYFIGSRAGGGVDRSEELAEEKKKHEDFRSDVREHFQQTSAIMSRLAEDYREMHQHMSVGAERLADMDREKLAGSGNTESLTADRSAAARPSSGSDHKSDQLTNTGSAKAEAKPAETQSSANKPASAADAKVNGGKPAQAPTKQPSEAADKPAAQPQQGPKK